MVGRAGREHGWWGGRGKSMSVGEGGERAWVVGREGRVGREHECWRGRGWWGGRGESMGGG